VWSYSVTALHVRTLTQLLSLEQPKVLYYLEPQLLAYGGSLFIYGRAGTFKSFLAIELMHSLATGRKWLIYDTAGPTKTLMLQAEQVEAMYQDRMLHYTHARIKKPGTLDKHMLFATSQNLKLDDFRGVALLEEAIKTHTSQVVLIDCLYRVIKSSTDVASVGRFLDDLSRLSSTYGVAFVIVHHPRKESDEDRGFDELTGWSGIANWADSILRVTREPDSFNLSLSWEKTKNARTEVSDVNVRVNQLRFVLR
jgi:RecA-family ATPase